MSIIRNFVLRTTEHYYNQTDLSFNEKAEEALSDFIHHSHTLLLQSLIHNNILVLHTKIQYDKKSIVFYKSSAIELIADGSINHINIVTLTTNAAESLYHILKQIYSPLLANDNDLFSNNIQKNLSDLESNLRIITHGKANENVNVIFSIEDEVAYWKSLREKKDASKKERENALAYHDLFEDICEEIRSMQACSLSEIREATENIGGILDDVWRLTGLAYSEDRMIHIFNIIGHMICLIIQKTIPPTDLWKVQERARENEMLLLLSDCMSVIQTWISACRSLTETYWPNYALHTWNDKLYIPPFCIKFEKRLKEIYEIRATYCQLNKLLTKNERDELKIQYLFEPFENINIWIYNGPNQAWEAALARFSSNLRPAETKIAEKLKPRLHNTSTKQMLYEFMRYKALIDRPLVKSALNNELVTFVTSLLSMLKTIRDQMDSDDIDVQMYQPPEMSPVVQQVQWAKQMEAKVKDIRACAEKYLSDFDRSSELLKLADQLLKDLKTMYTQMHEDWSRELLAQVNSGSLQLRLEKPVVEFSGARKMLKVQYEARAVRCEREARTLKALGLPPPPPVAAALQALTDALGHAQRLQQVASFHNTLGERMIPSTRPMMLRAALALSALVQEQRPVYWDDAGQIARYTDELMRAVLELEKQNTYLTNQHIAIRSIVEKLLDTELLAQQTEWKKKVKDIRDVIEKVEANGYKNTESWRTHWDMQLYKALECQYIRTLLSLHKHFPHVKVDLVLRGRAVVCTPPLEQLRAKHYQQLRRLAALPAHITGVRDDAAGAAFADIVHEHSWLGNKAVQQLEAALSSLERSCVSWTQRAALACVDLDALCAEHLKEPADWEINFKACKAYGQAVAKMTFEDEKIEWITVGTVSLRREFEAQTRSLWACLMSSLQASCRADSLALDAFIANAGVMLENKAMPKNAKDLAEISAKQQALQNNMPEMEKTVENLKRKSHMLRTWGGDSTAEGVIKEWQKIRELMLSQQQLFEHQAEIVKSSLNGEWENLNTSVEAFTSRWSQNKPRLEDTRGAQFTEVAARCRSVFEAQAQWDKFVTDRDELMKECEKFNLELEPSDTWKEAEKLMKDYAAVWTVFRDYNEEYEAIVEQEWIVFQKKIHLLDEFVSKWTTKLEPFTAITLYIQQELDKYSDLTTMLKYLRGTEFTERHWREVYSLLDIEYKKPDTLKVNDLLAVAVNIKKQIKALQKICTAASSEAAVRSALNELELWFAGARLTITYYSDKAKRATPIVRDFKEILSKIEEQQWVVSSVSGGGDACAAWESRLRAARACVRAAAHAQRRAAGWQAGIGGRSTAREWRRRAGQCSERRAESPDRGMALRALFIVCALIAGGGAVYNRERDRQRADPRLLDRACELSSCYPATGNLLIGRESRLFASSTCGVHGRERYCIVSHLEDRKKCFWCESTNNTLNNPILNHRIQNIIYKFYPGTRSKSWWQSENGKENVTIELDMEAEFHLTHLIIAFKTFRPAAMLVERSFDFGKTWRVYRYFAYNCDESFPGVPKHSQRSLTEIVCESRYSGVAPSTEGEVIFRVLPPNINVTNPYSEEVQNLLRMTNLRINFTKLHTLGDDLLDNRAEIQEKYYYSIYEMTVRGSCSCYGHASRCLPMPGVESKNNMVHGRCECTHNTRGLNCEYCEDFYNDLPWQPAVGKTSNACKRCTCNNHATTCHFDPAVYNKTGKISGGVCDNCQHNTIGLNCERCEPKYYKDPNLDIQSPDICKQCDCDPDGTTDKEVLCDDETDPVYNKTAGRCLCKLNVDGSRCDRCKDGYWNFDPKTADGCISCTCNSLGTINERGCDQLTGNCFCKRHVTGRNCDQCLPEFFGLSDTDDGCLSCDCDVGGSIDRDCDVITGQCKCRPNVTGRRCDQPIQNFFVGALDSIVIEGESSQCDSQIDDNAIQSQLCHVVIRESFPEGKETWTGPGFMKIPEGSTLVFVVNNLKTSMNYNVLIRYEPQSSVNWEEATILVKRPLPIDFDSPCANVRPEDDTVYTNLPANQRSVLVKPAVCLEKGKETEIRIYLGRQDGRTSNSRASVLIDSIVLIPSFEDLPFLANRSSMREEFDRYDCGNAYYYSLNRDTVPEICKKYHASIGFYIRNGTESCQCDPSGSKSHQCSPYTGYCQCVENIVGPRCDRCAPGTYGFSKFGCKRCDCNSIGSLDNFCDATSGQCKCRANTYGRACDLCQPGYFNFPNCQQCDCNGHAMECDDKTGACRECRDYTEGHRCERCVEGFYGDPRLGVDIPCRSCPCPGVINDPNKSSHADRCELDPETKDVVCDCKEGYAGLLCDVCADNYYGDPVKGTCEKCECNDNIDITKPGNCDPYTGKCLQCLHNTAGDNCEVCQTGFYGNALEKACYKCNCSVLGTNLTIGNCDGITGQCPCFNNVMGTNCDQCTENHWRIALGTGCDPCDCDPVGSLSPQCNPYIGKCDCKSGHGGRQCDQCQENFWGDPNEECHECECNLYGSLSQQCMRENGSCVCKPGIGGYNCDNCARGYLGEAPYCYACGECFDNWDRLINDLRVQTESVIANAGKIKLVGATGAYTRDFDEMTKKLSDVENMLLSAKQGQTTVRDLLANITTLQDHLAAADKKVKESNDNLNAITSKINLGNVTLDGLRNSIELLKFKTVDLGNNATKLQEANLEGALNLTREAKQRATKASDEAEGVQTIIANTDRQIKNTDRLIELQYTHFNNTQNDNEKKLDDLQSQLSDLESRLPKLNEKMCGQESDSCDICGGAGCGKCGGISCDLGAVTKAEQALDFANKTEHRIKEHELTAEDLFRSISQVKQDTVSVRSRAKDLFNKANEFKSSAEIRTNDSVVLTAELKDFLSNTSNTPADVRTLANDILNLSIRIEPKEITELSQRINSTVSQLTNIENIITETKPDLERAKALKQNATAVNKAANLTLEMANKVLQALDEAQAAQDAAENAINKANSDIEAANSDLVPIAQETEQAQKKANETKDEVEGLRLRLSDLQKDILKIESDAEQVKQEANDVVNRAEGAEQKARQLRQDFKQTNMSLAERASQTSNSRERAQLLLNRATKLASETQMQLKQLANMEELYNDHSGQLNTLEKEIGELNSLMNYYLSEITKRSDYYRSCTT